MSQSSDGIPPTQAETTSATTIPVADGGVRPQDARLRESSGEHRLFARVRRDCRRYFDLDSRDGCPRLLEKIRLMLGSPGLHATLVYRFGHWVDATFGFALVRYPLKFLYHALDKLCIICWGIHIDEGAVIDGGLYIGHFGGVLIGPVKMGRDCNISQQVTIGMRADGVPGVPTIGDRVWIGTSSVVFGNIRIGDGVTIGAVTSVSRSLPAGLLVTGNPMRVLRRNYDNSELIYGKLFKAQKKAI